MSIGNGKNYTRKITYKSVNQRIATTINNNMFYIQYNEIILEKNKKALKLKYESQFWGKKFIGQKIAKICLIKIIWQKTHKKINKFKEVKLC